MAGTTLTGISAAILAGGLGTRLRSVVADRPKVLAPVSGKPFLAHLLDQLQRFGVEQTVLLVGYGADRISATFGPDYSGTQLTYSTETSPQGTGGALRLALPYFQHDTILLMNGDSYCDVDLAELLLSHRQSHADVSLTLTEVPDAARFGRVLTGPDNRVTEFQEKDGLASVGRINAGIYLLSRSLIEGIPANQPISLERELLPRWVLNKHVHGYLGGGRFIDIGTPESFGQAENFFSSRKVDPKSGRG